MPTSTPLMERAKPQNRLSLAQASRRMALVPMDQLASTWKLRQVRLRLGEHARERGPLVQAL
jgi:hypothetical protein